MHFIHINFFLKNPVEPSSDKLLSDETLLLKTKSFKYPYRPLPMYFCVFKTNFCREAVMLVVPANLP